MFARNSGTTIPALLALVAASACATPDDSQSVRWERLETLEQAVPAQPVAPARLAGGAQEFVEFAVRNRPELRAALARWRATEHQAQAVDRWPDPQISYGLFVQSVETRVGPQRHRVGVMQPIPWPAKPRANSAVVSAQADVAATRHDALASVIRGQVEEAWWAWWVVGQRRHWLEQQAAILESLAASVRAKTETGAATIADIGQVEVALSRTRDAIGALDAEAAHAEASLRAAANVPEATAVEISGGETKFRTLAETDEELYAAAANHPSIRAIAQMRHVTDREAEAAALGPRPDFSLGVDWIETGEALMPNTEGSGKDPVIAMVAVKLPIWFGDYAAAEDAAHARGLAYEADAEAAAAQSAAKVRRALADIRESARRAALYRDTLIPQAEAVYGSVLGSYEVGRSGTAAILLAQRDLIELRLTLANQAAMHERAWAALQATVGRPVKSEKADD